MKLRKSTILFLGLIILCSGIFLISYNYLKTKKDNAFAKMNVLLYESETPEEIESEEELEEKQEETPLETTSETTQSTGSSSKSGGGYKFIGTLEIPKINLKRGFLSLNSKYNNVDYNITMIQGSTMPDEKNNNLIFAAHSGYCSICYFHNLYKLKVGDKAYISYKNNRYSYKLVDIYYVKKTGKVAINRNPNKNCLTLITCTKNDDTKQTVYIFELE